MKKQSIVADSSRSAKADRAGRAPGPLEGATFQFGAAQEAQLPPAAVREIAFAGRSNAGKSSAINALARQTRLAYASRTPGRTQQINFFELRNGAVITDLPGYGYAAVERAAKLRWQQVMADYLQVRRSLSGVVLGRPSDVAIKKDQPLAAVLPFEPTTRRAFSKTEAVAALLRLYQSEGQKRQPVSLTTRIVNDADATVFERTTELPPEAFEGSMRAAEHQLRLPLATLPPGQYLLTFEARLDKRLERATPVRFQVK